MLRVMLDEMLVGHENKLLHIRSKVRKTLATVNLKLFAACIPALQNEAANNGMSCLMLLF